MPSSRASSSAVASAPPARRVKRSSSLAAARVLNAQKPVEICISGTGVSAPRSSVVDMVIVFLSDCLGFRAYVDVSRYREQSAPPCVQVRSSSRASFARRKSGCGRVADFHAPFTTGRRPAFIPSRRARAAGTSGSGPCAPASRRGCAQVLDRATRVSHLRLPESRNNSHVVGRDGQALTFSSVTGSTARTNTVERHRAGQNPDGGQREVACAGATVQELDEVAVEALG